MEVLGEANEFMANRFRRRWAVGIVLNLDCRRGRCAHNGMEGGLSGSWLMVIELCYKWQFVWILRGEFVMLAR